MNSLLVLVIRLFVDHFKLVDVINQYIISGTVYVFRNSWNERTYKLLDEVDIITYHKLLSSTKTQWFVLVWVKKQEILKIYRGKKW